MSVTSRDTSFSSTKFSWVIGSRTYGLDFTRPEGADDILLDKMFNLPVGTITKEIPNEIAISFSMAKPQESWDSQEVTASEPKVTRVGPAGVATMVQIQFHCPFSGVNEPGFTTATILFHSGAYDCAEALPTEQANSRRRAIPKKN
jgi:hypothetical protein